MGEGRDEQHSILDGFGNRAGAFGYGLCLFAIHPSQGRFLRTQILSMPDVMTAACSSTSGPRDADSSPVCFNPFAASGLKARNAPFFQIGLTFISFWFLLDIATYTLL